MDSEELRCTEPNDAPIGGTLVGGAVDPENGISGGDKLGRYVVLAHKGEGAMGVVYAAYDPQLDRRIALKLMHQHGADEEQAERASRRMLGEAKAMAQLSHPNVITVHDVGTIDGRVFIAMEFVEGVPLSEWMRAPERNWKEILAVFTRAGRGLRAAHDAGLVHRDFKPDNVLVDADGRVRVLDFGLARRLDGTRDTVERRDREAGTPAYMSPEQHLGKPLDHRADQFSFCVALYEALYGEMPFAAKTRLELALAVTDGRVGPAPRRAVVPNWLRYVLLRGLDPDPEGRWDSMGELLSELGRDPTTRWPKIVAWTAAGVVAVAAITTTAVLLMNAKKADGDERVTIEPVEQCALAAVESRLEVWNPDRAAAVHSAFTRSDQVWARKLGPQVEADLSRWAMHWEAMHRETCAATVQGSQSDSMLDQRMLCLGRERTEFDEFVSVLGSGEAERLQSAAEGVARLPRLDACTASALDEAPMVERSAAERERVAKFDKLVSRANTLVVLGSFTHASEAALAAEVQARALDDDSLVAEALLARARVELVQGQRGLAAPLLEEAEFAAERASADDLRGEILIELARVDATFGDGDAANRRIREARAVLDRVGAEVIDYARLDGVLALALASEGKLDDAEAKVRAAIASLAEVEPPPVELGRLHLTLGVLLRESGEFDVARSELALARELWIEHYGDQHPIVAEARVEQARLDARLGAYEVAAAGFTAAIEVFAGALGETSLDVGEASEGLALALAQMDRHDESIRAHQRARAIFRAHGSNAAVALGLALDAEGVVRYELGQLEEALTLHEGALRELEGAREHRSFRTQELERVRMNLARVLIDLDRLPEARAELEQALTGISPGAPKGQVALARAQWLAARAWSVGGNQDPARARDLARSARRVFAELGRETEVERIEQWLDSRG